MSVRSLSLTDARRAAINGAMLGDPRPTSVLKVVRWLGGLQVDPTAAVARAEQLVPWSRLGTYDIGELRRLLDETGELFEYGAFLYPTEDLPMHRVAMESYPRGDSARPRYERQWLEDNADFRAYILGELESRGPLRSRDLEDRAEVPWKTGGWNDGKNLGPMLDMLWLRGEIAIASRAGTQRVWDLVDRVLPPVPPAAADEVARWALETQLRRRGVSRAGKYGYLTDGRRPDAWREAHAGLVADGVIVPVSVAGMTGEWMAHAEVLEMPFSPRTTLLAPFDRLITDRDRLEELFSFSYRLEMYVAAARRKYGYYVLPILHGDRFVGRIDPRFDRASRVLTVNAVFAEPDAPASAWRAVRASIDELAAWLGAERVELPALPAVWRPRPRRASAPRK